MFELLEYYPTEDAAMEQFKEWRWADGIRCPNCDGLRINLSRQKMPYRCKDCRKRFSLRTGTIMAASNLPFRTWIVAVYLLSVNTKGIASTQLAKELAVTQKTAWNLAQRIRKAIGNSGDTVAFDVELEADETPVGGKEPNKDLQKQRSLGRCVSGEQTVIGFKEPGEHKIREKNSSLAYS